MTDDKRMPNSIEAEDALLGSLLIDRTAIVLVQGKLKPADFYRERCGTIFQAMLDCAADGEAIDIITVSDRLERAGRLDECGGREYLASVIADVPSSMHTEYYAKVIKRHASARRLISAAGELAQVGYSDAEADDMLASAEVIMQKVRQETDTGNRVVSNVDAISRFMEWQDYLSTAMEKRGSLPESPWSNVNAFIPAFMPGTMTIVAAPPGHGKTIFGEGVAEHNARLGKRVLYLHPELTIEQMIARQMARYGTTFSMANVVRGDTDRDETTQIANTIYGWPGSIYFRYCPGFTAAEAGALIRREAALGRCDLAIVDYLHILQMAKERGQSDEMALGQAALTIKMAGAQAGVPVILLAQINREYAGRTKEPRLVMSDLRGSGQIEAVSNAIIMLYNRSVAEQDDTQATVMVYVVKNTFSKLGSCEMLWDKPHYRFTARVMGI